jgi:hypothetical protein
MGEHVACMGKKKSSYKIVVENLKEKAAQIDVKENRVGGCGLDSCGS